MTLRLIAWLASTAWVAMATTAIAQNTVPPGAPPVGQAAAANDPGEIIVTGRGIRGSLLAAQEVKRRASSVVEAVTSEDLGKFSDLNIADSLQRVPGLQIERNDSGNNGDRISIRGLGPDFVQTTVNGRVALSYGNEGITGLRAFNLDVVPSEVITGVKIYKTPTAELVEPGLAGAVELETLHPLDYRTATPGQKFFGSLTMRGDYDSIREKVSPRVSGIVGGKIADGKLGFYVGGIYADTKVRQDEFTVNQAPGNITVRDMAGGPTRTISNILLPNPTASNDQGTSERRAIVAGLQGRPSERLEFNVDFLFSQFDRRQERNDIIYNLGSGPLQGVFNPGSYTIAGGAIPALSSFNQAGIDYTGVAKPGVGYQLINLTYNNLANNYQVGSNIIYHGDAWTAKIDYSYSKSELKQDLLIPTDGGFTLPIADASFNAIGEVPQFNIGSNNVSSTALFSNVPVWIRRQYQNNSDSNAVRLDLAHDLGARSKIKLGARYSDTNVDVRQATLVTFPDAAQAAAMGAAQVTGRTITLFPGYNIGTNTFPLLQRIKPNPIYNSIIDPSSFGVGALGGDFATANTRAYQGFGLGPAGSYKVEEQTTALYGQIDTGGSVGGLGFDANFGVRAVNVLERATAFSSVELLLPITLQSIGNTTTVTTDRRDYWEVLPAANITLKPTDMINIRLSAARTMSLPQYEQLAPTNSLRIISATDAAGNPAPGFDPNARGVGSAGNTQLKPLTAWQFDVTGELYNRANGAFYASVYYKIVNNFPLSIAQQGVTLPGRPGLFDIFQVSNYSGGKVFGAEIGLSQPFTFLPSPFDGFGVQANYNYVDTSFDRLDPTRALAQGFPGASKHNVNGTVYYEKHGFAIRAAYVYRSAYLALLGQPTLGRASQPTSTRAFGTLDASVSYKLTRNLELIVAGQNLTEQNRYDYTNSPDVTRAFFTRPRTISVSARASF